MIEEKSDNCLYKKKTNFDNNSHENERKQKKKWKNTWILFIPPVVAFLCYLNALGGDFVHDDIFAIKNNPDVTGKSSASQLFYNDFWGKQMSDNSSHKSYRPLTVLTFRWNYYLTGRDPFYFHIVNVFLHVFVTFLFVHACNHVFHLPRTCCFVAGLLFAAHPIHTEAIAGIVGRADLLAALFFLLAFLAYTGSLDGRTPDFPVIRDRWLFCLSLMSSCTGMLCKETGITALGVCLLYDVGVACRIGVIGIFCNRKPVMASLPLVTRVFILTVFTTILLLFRVWIMDGSLPAFLYQDNPASFQSSIQTRMLTYSYLWTYNLWLMLAPAILCYDWQNGSIPLVKNVLDVRNLATLVTAVVLMSFLFKSVKELTKSHRSSNHVFMCIVFTVVPFLPASNVFFRVGFVIAERVLYIPSLGFCLCIAVGFHKLSTRWRRILPVLSAFLGFLILMQIGKTYQQNKVWRSRESLFRSGTQALPHNAKVHYNYANFLKDTGIYDKARDHYREVLRLDSKYASAHNNLGTLLDNSSEAEIHFREALRLVPRHQSAHINLGNSLFKRGHRTEGLRYLYKAVEIEYRSPEALTSMGWSLLKIGNLTDADNYLKMAIEVAPDDYDANLHYGALLERRGNHKKSAVYYKKAYELDPSQTVTLLHAASAYNRLGDIVQAEDLIKRAMKIRRDPNTLEQLAMLYFHSGRQTESLSLYEEIRATLSSNSTDVMLRYSKVLGSTGDLAKAEDLLMQVLHHDTLNVEVLQTIGQVCASRGKHVEAIEYLSRAIDLGKHRSGVDLVKMHYDRANNHKDIRQYEEALQDFRVTLKLSPTHDGAHANAGTIYHMNGNIKKARYHYKEALKHNPTNGIVMENLAKLDRLQVKRKHGIE